MGTLVTLRDQATRDRVSTWAQKARVGSRVELLGPKRSANQNDKMWAMLTDISEQMKHRGRDCDQDQWKVIFLHALGHETQFLESLNGESFVPYGQRSSRLSKEEMSDLHEFISAWGAENGIVFRDPLTVAAEAQAA